MAKRGHGEGSIYRRKDGRWTAEISLEGGKSKSFYGKTRKEVQEKLKTALYEQQKGMLVTGPQQKVGPFLTHWLEDVHKQSIRSRTYERYEEIVRLHLVPEIGHHQLQKLSPQHLQSFYKRNWRQAFRLQPLLAFITCCTKRWKRLFVGISSRATPAIWFRLPGESAMKFSR